MKLRLPPSVFLYYMINLKKQHTTQMNAGTFALKNFRSRERKFHIWNFRSRERKSHGTFALSQKNLDIINLGHLRSTVQKYDIVH